ncbi:methyltransferase [Flavobacterium sp. DG1-102-2]|uniref:tRNA1(Val) (adenine(37)-N6)-methyltransferase n=1 Tax=Flavobacterium sp. DG1-102-2 TaxID=3081663 RepID=UPI00294A2D66|nr:methyltransferase [Flavobacterium sp. DG1-102-2]MDV6169384.1 methyltransferase [Flavobacterium sp. DG1-102-2]
MFQFKQFSIQQDKCAMKVGTDGVLLGAWAPVDHKPFSILDIGAGTGLIALMLAQRSHAEQIDGIEIDDDAYEQAVDNFENSPWGDRLFCYHAGLDEFMDEPEDEYDLIVSNPPFYTDGYFSGDEQRDKARFTESLPFEDLIEASALLLSEHGVLAVIIPFKEEEKLIALAKQDELYPFKITHVKGTPATEVKRSLIAFSRFKKETAIDELTIELERHKYTDEYILLTQDFYLKM